MLNFVAILWMTYFALNVWPPTPRNPLIASKDLPGPGETAPVTVGEITIEGGGVAVGLAVVLAVAFRKTRFGYAVRLYGRERPGC